MDEILKRIKKNWKVSSLQTKRIIINLENINNLEEKSKESLRMLDEQLIERISTMIE